jgi:hypothetical protein
MRLAGRMLVLAAALSVATTGLAEQRPGSVYAIGGIAAAHQAGPTGVSHQTYKTAPGGTTLGWQAGVGVFVTRSVSVEAGYATTGTMSAREPSRYGMTFNEERRDRILSLAARFHLPQWGPVRVEPVVGVGVTWPEASSQTERLVNWTTPQERVVQDPRIEHRLDTGVGVTFGCDLRLGRGRVALLPTFRVTDTGVSGGFYDETGDHIDIGPIYPGGYPRWTVMGGIALRVDF